MPQCPRGEGGEGGPLGGHDRNQSRLIVVDQILVI